MKRTGRRPSVASILVLLLLSAPAVADDPFETATTTAIQDLVRTELFGHYDVESVSLVDTSDLRREWSLPLGYGVRLVTARFRAVRNGEWNEHLNREIPQSLCDETASLYPLCRPAGFELSGTLEVHMVYTRAGWEILSRHHRSRRAYPLARYLHCRPDPADSDPQRALIRACFGGE